MSWGATVLFLVKIPEQSERAADVRDHDLSFPSIPVCLLWVPPSQPAGAFIPSVAVPSMGALGVQGTVAGMFAEPGGLLLVLAF